MISGRGKGKGGEGRVEFHSFSSFFLALLATHTSRGRRTLNKPVSCDIARAGFYLLACFVQ